MDFIKNDGVSIFIIFEIFQEQF